MTCPNQLSLSPRIFSQIKGALGGGGTREYGKTDVISSLSKSKSDYIILLIKCLQRSPITIKGQTYYYNVQDLSLYSFFLCFQIQHSPFPAPSHTHTYIWSFNNSDLLSVLWMQNTFSRIHHLLPPLLSLKCTMIPFPGFHSCFLSVWTIWSLSVLPFTQPSSFSFCDISADGLP